MTDAHFARRYLQETNATNATAPPATEAVFFEYTIVSRFTPGITIFANIAFVMFCLKQLLHMATAQIDEFPEYRFVKDKFQSREEGQNWNYDFVIVTSIKDEGHKLVDDLQRKNSMRNIVSALENADLETEQYKSRKFDKVFIKIRASRERLEEEADRLNMKFRLDERNVKQRLLDGQPDPLNPDEYDVYPRKNGWTYKGFQMETAITDTEDQCPYASDRGVLYIPPYAIDARRLHETRPWVVLLLILSMFRARSRLDVCHAQVLRVYLWRVPLEPRVTKLVSEVPPHVVDVPVRRPREADHVDTQVRPERKRCDLRVLKC